MEVEAIYAVALRELTRYLRAKERIISTLVMPILWLLIFGSGMRSSVNMSGLDYFTFIAPGIIAMSLMQTSIFSGVSIIWDKELGFMKEMLVAPVSRTSIVLGKAIGTAITSLLQGLMVLIISIILGLEISLGIFLLIIPLMILISVGLVGIGLSIGSILDNIEGFGLVMNFLVMPMFFLSGALFSIEQLPSRMRFLTYFDPLTYAVESLRYTLTGVSTISFTTSLPVIVGFSILTMSISTFLFSRRS